MLDALKQLFENNVISEEIKESIESAWAAKITENRELVAQELREEFAQKYEHDKNVMYEAVDQMITDGLMGELMEFADDRRQLAEMKVKYAKKMKSDKKLMKEFVSRQLASEIKELHEDQVQSVENFKKLEQFVIESLAEEITEFYKDKQELAETKVRLVREGKKELLKTKKQFVERASKLVNKLVNESLAQELTTLKEDIDAARRNDFGRKLFEAFANEYQTSYLNEHSEVKRLLKIIEDKNKTINETKQIFSKSKNLIESKQKEIALLKENNERKEIMHELLSPLNTEQKEIMHELLETVQTNKLTESFNKYLPSVMAGQPSKVTKPLFEGKEITGNKVTPSNKRSTEEDSNIIEIRRLAGIRN